jgi:DNA-binding transcriptional MerR regulator
MDATRNDQAWKVGALAKATGLTVRALHHYDHIGLPSPSMRTTAGHRLYTADDVARLYRIRLLRSLGFPLEQISSVLEDPGWQLAGSVRRHLEHTRDKAAIAARLCRPQRPGRRRDPEGTRRPGLRGTRIRRATPKGSSLQAAVIAARGRGPPLAPRPTR